MLCVWEDGNVGLTVVLCQVLLCPISSHAYTPPSLSVFLSLCLCFPLSVSPSPPLAFSHMCHIGRQGYLDSFVAVGSQVCLALIGNVVPGIRKQRLQCSVCE